MERGDELKMWLAVREDIEIPPEKLAAQAGHGFCEALMRARDVDPETVALYRATSHAKIVVRAKNEAFLRRVEREAAAAGIPNAYIVDEGRTVFPEPTATVCAFGPCRRSDLPNFLRRLRMMGEAGTPEETEA